MKLVFKLNAQESLTVRRGMEALLSVPVSGPQLNQMAKGAFLKAAEAMANEGVHQYPWAFSVRAQSREERGAEMLLQQLAETPAPCALGNEGRTS